TQEPRRDVERRQARLDKESPGAAEGIDDGRAGNGARRRVGEVDDGGGQGLAQRRGRTGGSVAPHVKRAADVDGDGRAAARVVQVHAQVRIDRIDVGARATSVADRVDDGVLGLEREVARVDLLA